MTFIIESWFWRGTQSAIFYYVSCAPCADYRHKRKRMKAAARAEKVRGEIVITQPGIIPQPGPFQTNEAWGEEMVAGPGPPKGWKSDKLIQQIKQKMRNEVDPKAVIIDDAQPQSHQQGEQASGQNVMQSVERRDFGVSTTPRKAALENEAARTVTPPALSLPELGIVQSPATDHETDTTPSSPSSSPEVSKSRRGSTDSRPIGIRKMSTTYVAVKDSLKSSLHPERWNWKRYDREDEVLGGFERLNRIWDRATGHTSSGQDGEQPTQPGSRKRAGTNESERYDYNRARHPEVNDLHPPVVSQLPSTREAAAWMLMAPPSRAVMEGKEKPNPEATMRWPLARIGTTREEERIRREAVLTNSLDPLGPARSRPSSKGKERASTAEDAHVASDQSSIRPEEDAGEEDDGDNRSLKKENTASSPASPTSFPFPVQQNGIIARPTPRAHLFSEARKSWPDPVTALQVSGDGTHSPSQRWSYSSVWLA